MAYVDPRLAQDIARAEAPGGVACLEAYQDGGGVWTIGYGHTGPEVVQGLSCTQDQANAWLNADIDEARQGAIHLSEWPMLDTPCRMNAVTECVFNLGLPHWQAEFPATRAAIRAQNWQAVHDNLLASPLWIRQVGVGRVTRLATYLLTGSYPASI
jgi:GH24 family phage-related lysozyme (muramidase)